jgi:hypothetical protein
MINFTISDQKYLISILIVSVVSVPFLMAYIHVGIVRATVTNSTQTKIPSYEITTR